ncbi:plasmid segregation protein ParM [Weissella uvarum]|uniref:ParM/StbA family protein n=1 Tax=Weissella uvarum TaxID=1479233 RepID=UPI00195F2895|nr:ParM/StbA family protein [Weissella uvarum]MBM7617888.1 plasmid segregation protein ParM [Weissella uvarum]MCM0596114.1 ParM/StbA family protein [Weissella uvarum]
MAANTLKMGIDLGNRQTKIYIPEQEGVKKPINIVYPSALLPANLVGESTFGSLMNNSDLPTTRKFQLTNDNNGYIWGESLTQFHKDDGILQSIAKSNRYEMDEYKLLSKFALAEGVLQAGFADEPVNISLSIGLPDDDYDKYSDSDLIKSIYKNAHSVEIDDKVLQFKVTKLQVLQQGLGAPIHELIDFDGNVINPEILTQRTVWVDMGGGTIIINTFDQFRALPDLSSIYWNGSDTIYRKLAQLIAKNQQVKVDIDELESQIKKGERSYKVSRNQTIDFTDELNEVLQETLTILKNKIQNTVADMDAIDNIFFSGGTAQIFDPEDLKGMFGFGEIVPDGDMANAIGFVKAQSMK